MKAVFKLQPRGRSNAVNRLLITFILLANIPSHCKAQVAVPGHTLNLPKLLVTRNGSEVNTAEMWRDVRRPEILELFKEHVYGHESVKASLQKFEVFDTDEAALGGKAIRKQVAITNTLYGKSLRIDLLLYLPLTANEKPAPVFVLLNFGGNHTINADSAIRLPTSHIPEEQQPRDAFRGSKSSRFPIDQMLARGYGVATAFCADIDPDQDDGFKNGVHGLFDDPANRKPDDWGTVGGWAWGLSRMMDYLESDELVDAKRVAVLGHSRLGKTALWAGAQDERFAMVISNNSGCTGAALARRKHGETVKAINDRFPHWFCENYRNYNDKEEELPVDQHMLLALVAPRPVYVASASKDDWADPTGEFLSCVHAGPVYELFGKSGLPTSTMPKPNAPVSGTSIGYHLREGKHDLTLYDWERYMDFADKQWR